MNIWDIIQNSILRRKADLVDGKVPVEQLDAKIVVDSTYATETQTISTSFEDVATFSLAIPDGAVLISCRIKFEFMTSLAAKTASVRVQLDNGAEIQTSVQWSTTSAIYVAKLETDATDIGGLEKLVGQNFIVRLQAMTTGAIAFTKNWDIRTIFV